MTYQECVAKLKDYEYLRNKTVDVDSELFKVKHPLICPVNNAQFAGYVDSYLKQSKSAETSLTPFLGEELQIVLKALRLSDKSIALLDVSDITLIP